MFYCCGITEKGIMSHNEDALLIGKSVLTSGCTEQHLSPPFIAAVSDGVSGESSGEVASAMCLEKVAGIDRFRKNSLRSALMDIHHELAEFSVSSEDHCNMQTTLCGIAVDEDGTVTSFNVGDSRLYRFRHGNLRQLSRDQSLVQLLFEEGSITHEERRTHVHRNIIFPAFGNLKDDPTIDTDEIRGGIDYGDVLLLCTDGLSDYLSPLDIQEILDLPKSLPKRLSMLVRRALERGCSDNISAVAIVCDEKNNADDALY